MQPGVAQLTAKLNVLKTSLDGIVRQQANIETHLRAKKLLLLDLSPTLPPELWSEIFLRCAPTTEFLTWGSSSDPRRLALVCKQWKGVIDAIPQFWTSLSLLIHANSITSQRHMLHTMVERSKEAPISLELVWYPSGGGVEAFLAFFEEHIFSVIGPSRHRWCRLSLALPDCLVNRVLTEPMHSLVDLSISTFTMDRIEARDENFPSLKKVSILGVYHNPERLGLPWHQLTQFRSAYALSVDAAHRLLRQCSKLEDCTLRIVHARGPMLHHITLPRIRRFSLWHVSSVNEALRSFTLPNLVDLDVDLPSSNNYIQFYPFASNSIFSLLKRSSCSLKSLRVKGYGATEENAQLCINQIPTLTGLVLISRQGQESVTDEQREILAARQR